MLHIYFGRESTNKEKFIFDHINKKTLLLVPDQFTLEAEQRAFSVLGVKGLMDLEIISPSRLGFRILSKVGGNKVVHVDKYGRHMLLTKILANEKENLEAFKGLDKMPAFIEMMNNLISEMKQYNTSPDQLTEIMAGNADNFLLHKKLKDIQRIYQKYEEYICNKYVDTEDYVNLFISKLEKYEEIKDRDVWIWGFDYFTPKNFDLIRELLRNAVSVNIVMAYDEGSRDDEVFEITGQMINKLKLMAIEENIKFTQNKIEKEYILKTIDENHKALSDLEKELFAIPYVKSEYAEGITLINAANIYAEVESAAAFIVELVRDKGLRFRDILVICNDMEIRGSIIKRTFEEYGLPIFLDKKRNVLHNPILEFISALIDINSRGWLSQDVFRLAKTGLSDLTNDEVEKLENYVHQYKIKGNLWKKEFKKGEIEYKAEGLAEINSIKSKLTDPILVFEKKYKEAETVEEKVRALYYFLNDQVHLPDKLEKLITIQVERKQQELADETSQIWGIVVGILEQLIELLGKDKVPNREFAKILASGFEAMEIGIIPPTLDRIMVGTMQRTRGSALKALVIIGANDGVLPQDSVNEGLLSEDEKSKLYDNKTEICKIDELRIKEEKLAIYKTLAMPEKYLWIGYSISDVEGKELKQSFVFDKICQIFKNIEVEKDIISRGNPIDLISGKENAIKHMTLAVRKGLEGTPVEKEWSQVVNWYRKEDPEVIDRLERGIFYSGKLESLGTKVSKMLFKKETENSLKLSPSSIEKYGRCPFAFLMTYGLKPDERRVYEIAGREIGDIYHNCLMKMSIELSKNGGEITEENSPWMKITEEECQIMMERIIDEETADYKEGLFSIGAAENYKKFRIKKVCTQVAWVLIQHVRQGAIKRVEFEVKFGEGEGKIFPAIKVNIGAETVLIEGKIDRVDVLKNNSIKIIDYKSGKEKFDIAEVKAGYRLQLMLYLKAAQEAVEPNLVGAGVFYFQIDEPIIDASQMEQHLDLEKLEGEMFKSYKLDGIMLDDAEVIKSIAGEFSGYSRIFSIRDTRDGIKGTSEGKLLSNKDFTQLRETVDEKIMELCNNIMNGEMQAKPKLTKTGNACEYCQYKSICGFDLVFEGCEYERVN
jgi:ATP-dependent helicase/nuclease subunit B